MAYQMVHNRQTMGGQWQSNSVSTNNDTIAAFVVVGDSRSRPKAFYLLPSNNLTNFQCPVAKDRVHWRGGGLSVLSLLTPSRWSYDCHCFRPVRSSSSAAEVAGPAGVVCVVYSKQFNGDHMGFGSGSGIFIDTIQAGRKAGRQSTGRHQEWVCCGATSCGIRIYGKAVFGGYFAILWMSVGGWSLGRLVGFWQTGRQAKNERASEHMSINFHCARRTQKNLSNKLVFIERDRAGEWFCFLIFFGKECNGKERNERNKMY